MLLAKMTAIALFTLVALINLKGFALPLLLFGGDDGNSDDSDRKRWKKNPNRLKEGMRISTENELEFHMYFCVCVFFFFFVCTNITPITMALSG